MGKNLTTEESRAMLAHYAAKATHTVAGMQYSDAPVPVNAAKRDFALEWLNANPIPVDCVVKLARLKDSQLPIRIQRCLTVRDAFSIAVIKSETDIALAISELINILSMEAQNSGPSKLQEEAMIRLGHCEGLLDQFEAAINAVTAEPASQRSQLINDLDKIDNLADTEMGLLNSNSKKDLPAGAWDKINTRFAKLDSASSDILLAHWNETCPDLKGRLITMGENANTQLSELLTENSVLKQQVDELVRQVRNQTDTIQLMLESKSAIKSKPVAGLTPDCETDVFITIDHFNVRLTWASFVLLDGTVGYQATFSTLEEAKKALGNLLGSYDGVQPPVWMRSTRDDVWKLHE